MSTPTPVSGARRLRSMSYESAFSGETYTMRTPEPSASSASAGASARRARRSIPHRKAASVLPEPVGAQISVCAPEAIFGQPSACAGVGAANEASNQRLTASENSSSADLPVVFASVANPPILRRAELGPRARSSGRRITPRDREPRVSCIRHRFVWVALAACLIGAALASSAQGRDARSLRVVPASPVPSADGTLGAAARRSLRQGYLVPDQRAYERSKARAARENPSASFAEPLAPVELAPSTISSWAGASDPGFAPSDSTGAVGTQRFIQLVNSEFAIYDKGSTTPISSG